MKGLKLIEISEAKLEGVKKELSKFPMFGGIEQFIDLYNNGILSSENDIVSDIARLLEDSFVNVQITKNKKLLIKSEEEVASQNLLKLLEGWNILSSLKILANRLFDEGYVPETKIVFLESKKGVPQIELITNDEVIELNENGEEEIKTVQNVEFITHWSSDKLINKNDELVKMIPVNSFIKQYDEEGNYYIELADVIDINGEFLLEMEKSILSKTFSNK